MTTARKADPALWEEVKVELTQSSKGGEPGEWSARKAQLAVQEYKRRGGSYDEDGPDQGDTGLNAWTEQDWGTKSGGKSQDTGERYLPRKVLMLLTEDEYRRSTQKKRADSHAGDTQFSDQPEDVQGKVARIKEAGPTKQILYERAQDLEIRGRSSMSRDELLAAIDAATDENGRAKGSAQALKALTRNALYEKAQDEDIQGRSDMTKDELARALAEK